MSLTFSVQFSKFRKTDKVIFFGFKRKLIYVRFYLDISKILKLPPFPITLNVMKCHSIVPLLLTDLKVSGHLFTHGRLWWLKKTKPGFLSVVKRIPETKKYRVGAQQGQSYLMGLSCLFSLGWPPFWWCCHSKITFWDRCFITSTSLAPNFILLVS